MQALFARWGPIQEPGVYPNGSSSGGKRQGDEATAQGLSNPPGWPRLSLVMRLRISIGRRHSCRAAQA